MMPPNRPEKDASPAPVFLRGEKTTCVRGDGCSSDRHSGLWPRCVVVVVVAVVVVVVVVDDDDDDDDDDSCSGDVVVVVISVIVVVVSPLPLSQLSLS